MQGIFYFLNTHTPLFYWTQSLWRDEAFSVWIAQDGIFEIIRRTSGDFNPPLYYLLLYFWKELFGNSEIALRGFSFVAFLLFLIAVYVFAKAIFKSQKHAALTTVLMALNPMLLYFAFELRMYSLLCLFVTCSMYFFYTRQWKWYILYTILGLYTQPYMLFVLASQMLYLLSKKESKKIAVILVSIGLLYLPWIPTLLAQFHSSGPMWMYPINVTLVFSVLGNVFMGYEGTPGNLWQVMKIISLAIIVCVLLVWRQKDWRDRSRLFYYWLFTPLIAVLGISLFKPIYVHRYVIFVAIAEVFLISFFLKMQKEKTRNFLSFLMISILIIANIGAVSFHQKLPIRNTFAELTPQLKPTDVIYAQTPLIYYESLYYAPKNTSVYLYNPNKIPPPRYVGSIGMPESSWASTYPSLPQRAFVVDERGSYKILWRETQI